MSLPACHSDKASGKKHKRVFTVKKLMKRTKYDQVSKTTISIRRQQFFWSVFDCRVQGLYIESGFEQSRCLVGRIRSNRVTCAKRGSWCTNHLYTQNCARRSERPVQLGAARGRPRVGLGRLQRICVCAPFTLTP